MLLKLTVETVALCAGFLVMIAAFVAKDRKGGLHWYPNTVQREAVLRGLVSDQYIAESITEIHYIPDVDRMDFIPGFIRAPWMLYQMGLIYGKK